VSGEGRLSGLCKAGGVEGVTGDGATGVARSMAAAATPGAGVPRRCLVMVLAARGVSARWLLQRIGRLGWQPRLRINTGGTFRPVQSVHSRPLRELRPQTGTQGGTGTAFQGPRRRLNCTLLARWDAGYRDPWLLLTDRAPSAGEAGGDGLRAWLAQGFKITNRGGWQGQRPRMTDPQRAARWWLAVATLWLLSVGGLAEGPIPEGTLLPLADDDGPAARSRRAALNLSRGRVLQ
jgi:hypothetical protein